MRPVYARRVLPWMRRRALRLVAWLSVVAGAYGIVGVASLWGLLTGAFSGALGMLISLAVITDRPEPRTKRVAKVGLVLSALAVAACAVVLLVIVVAEL
jgi:hypothetical protein